MSQTIDQRGGDAPSGSLCARRSDWSKVSARRRTCGRSCPFIAQIVCRLAPLAMTFHSFHSHSVRAPELTKLKLWSQIAPCTSEHENTASFLTEQGADSFPPFQATCSGTSARQKWHFRGRMPQSLGAETAHHGVKHAHAHTRGSSTCQNLVMAQRCRVGCAGRRAYRNAPI